ncbi:MAG: T9SS type A sorting domain-containing protein, partial [Bacteroidota bacterium]
IATEENGNNGHLTTVAKAKPSTGLIVYPNPSKGDVNIITEVKQAGPLTIQVTDMQGRVVYEKAINSVDKGFQQIALRNLQLKASTYIVKVANRLQVQTCKLVVRD